MLFPFWPLAGFALSRVLVARRSGAQLPREDRVQAPHLVYPARARTKRSARYGCCTPPRRRAGEHSQDSNH
eukprot:5719292-Pleurochrysis_carterae.AAC.2